MRRARGPIGEWYDDYSGWGNEVLYRMCDEEPGHSNIDIVASKLWLIGRSYAATLERKAGGNFHAERSAWLLIESELDEKLESIRRIDRPDHTNLARILNVHSYLQGLLALPREKGGTGQTKRSLASKYLHFHLPHAFFLYDSISQRGVSEALCDADHPVPRLPLDLRSVGDPDYAHFSIKLIHYRDHVLEPALKKKATPRRIDMELQKYGWLRAEYLAAFNNRANAHIPELAIPGTMQARSGIILPRPKSRPTR